MLADVVPARRSDVIACAAVWGAPLAGQEFDFVLVHDAPDLDQARRLSALLPPGRSCLASRDSEMEALDFKAEHFSSLLTVVLVSARTPPDFFDSPSVARAIEQHHRAGVGHRLIVLYLDERPPLERLRPFTSLFLHRLGSLEMVASQLVSDVRHLRNWDDRTVLPYRHALSRLEGRGVGERARAVAQITDVYLPFVLVLLVMFTLCTGGIIWVLCVGGGNVQLAVTILGSLDAAVIALLAVVFIKSLNLAERIAQTASFHE